MPSLVSGKTEQIVGGIKIAEHFLEKVHIQQISAQ